MKRQLAGTGWGVLAAYFGVLAAAAGLAAERPFVHPLFAPHMVLQRETAAPVWGWTTPGATVSVSFASQTKSAVAAADGRWLARLEPLPASAEPRTLRVRTADARATVEIQDVLVGDIWL